jgi:hypothetical protein
MVTDKKHFGFNPVNEPIIIPLKTEGTHGSDKARYNRSTPTLKVKR